MQTVSPLALSLVSTFAQKYLRTHAQSQKPLVVRKQTALNQGIRQPQRSRCHIVRPQHKAGEHLGQDVVCPGVPLLNLLQPLGHRLEEDNLALCVLHKRLALLHASSHSQQFLTHIRVRTNQPKVEVGFAFCHDSRY